MPKQTDPSAVVIPFGKHRGATVAELLAKDPQYADWVMAQGWVAERFAELHAAIATRGAGTDDTPEHNSLQARFLDEGFRCAFLRMAVPRRLETGSQFASEQVFWRQKEEIKRHQRDIARSQAVIISYSDDLKNTSPEGKKSYEKMIADRHAEVVRNQAKVEELSAIIEPSSQWVLRVATNVAFEVRGIDVVIQWNYLIPDGREVGHTEKIGIELKPAIGDDYPSIMRQMQRLGCLVCVAGQYTGRGVSEAQLRQMFEANGQTLIFVQEIEEEVRKTP